MTFRFRPISVWVTERVTRLEKLWAQGLSAGKIAADLGGGLSRNAVIGKARRLHLTPHKSLAFQNKPKTRTIKRNLPRVRLLTAAERKPPTKIEKPVTVPSCQPVNILELENHQCSYATTDQSPHMFCGAKREHGAYCEYHASICYQPLIRLTEEERQRRRRQLIKIGRVITEPHIPPAAEEEYSAPTKLADPPMSDEEKAA